MNELMKQYKDITGKDARVMFIVIGKDESSKEYTFFTDEFVAWLMDQLRWRPTIEKPKEGQIVFAMIPTGWVVAQYLNGEFYVDDGFTFGDRISGVNNWLPIPEEDEDGKD